MRGKYKKRGARRKAEHWLGEVADRDRNLFAHWKFGILPLCDIQVCMLKKEVE